MALQGISFGTADEAGSFVNALFDKVALGKDFGESYNRYLAGTREGLKQMKEKLPYTAQAVETAGAIPLGVGKLGQIVAKAPLKAAAVMGGAYGFGAGEGGFKERAGCLPHG